MIRVTPLRLMTLQCSQIGFTLVRTFTDVLPFGPMDVLVKTLSLTGAWGSRKCEGTSNISQCCRRIR